MPLSAMVQSVWHTTPYAGGSNITFYLSDGGATRHSVMNAISSTSLTIMTSASTQMYWFDGGTINVEVNYSQSTVGGLALM